MMVQTGKIGVSSINTTEIEINAESKTEMIFVELNSIYSK
jgi:hypothetical protein